MGKRLRYVSIIRNSCLSCQIEGKRGSRRHVERRLPVSGLERCPACHPERSEGSLRPSSQILRCAQDDRPSLQMSEVLVICLTKSILCITIVAKRCITCENLRMTRKEQERPKGTKSRIPTFKTIEEEAAFWDTHSSEEFADELTPVENVKFVKARSKKALTVRFDEDTFEELTKEAREIGIGPSTLARMVILEHLRVRRAS
jgi:hypothetical protein